MNRENARESARSIHQHISQFLKNNIQNIFTQTIHILQINIDNMLYTIHDIKYM